MIDKKLLVESMTTQDIIDIMESYGCNDYIERDKEIVFKTICHHANQEDGSHKLYYYKKDKRFMCYTCCGSFDIFGFICRRHETLEQEYDFYKDVLLPLAQKVDIKHTPKSAFSEPYVSIIDRYKERITEVNIPPIDTALLNTYSFYAAPEWLNDGISEEVMRLYGIKYSINENKIIIPHYNEKGRLIGIRGRTLNKEEENFAKYMPVSIQGHMYSHPLGYNLYGLNMVAGNIRRIGLAIVTESEKACLQYDTMFGHKDNICVATCGSSLHDYQINLLIAAGAQKILLAYDKEGTTPAEENAYYNKLDTICKRYSHKVQMGYIRDMEHLLDLKDSPTDKGSETFLRLYWRNTVWI